MPSSREPIGAKAETRRARDARLELIAFWQDRSWRFDLPLTEHVTIGRASDNDVCIDHASVSRHHARLKIGDELVIEDLNAANGTYIQEVTVDATRTASMTPLRASAPIAIGQPLTLGAVTVVVRHAPSEISKFPSENDGNAEDDAAPPSSVVVRDAKLRGVFEQARRAAAADITVLIFGETGVGKELLARAIHNASPRATGPFQAINCGALPEHLLEGELFGNERGAFTGALQARPGLFEAANGGTVFLDEVGELTSATQVKLLRVLQEKVVMRVGARSTRPIDVRFVAATNRDLEADVAAGLFREDLFFRLNGLGLTIPPLRERPVEIEPLARSFVVSACEQMERTPLGLSDKVIERLRAYRWPGNVRELRNVMERAVVLCSGARLELEHLPDAVVRAESQPPNRASSVPPVDSSRTTISPDVEPERFHAEIRSLERLRIMEALRRCGGNQTHAAQLLGMSRRTLVSRMSEFNLPRPRGGRKPSR